MDSKIKEAESPWSQSHRAKFWKVEAESPPSDAKLKKAGSPPLQSRRRRRCLVDTPPMLLPFWKPPLQSRRADTTPVLLTVWQVEAESPPSDAKLKKAGSPPLQSRGADTTEVVLPVWAPLSDAKLKKAGSPPLQSRRAYKMDFKIRKAESALSRSHHAKTLPALLTAKLYKTETGYGFKTVRPYDAEIEQLFRPYDTDVSVHPSLPRSQSHRADILPALSEAHKVYLFFWHAYSPVIYSLYEIEVPKFLPSPPSKAAQELETRNPSPLLPMLQLKTGKYPDHMCCVQLGSKLYFFGGEFNNDNPYIDEKVKDELKNVTRDVFPREVYTFDLAFYSSYSLLSKVNVELVLCSTSMNSGKASPQAFVADEKIYVVGSICDDFDPKSFFYFEVYDPIDDNWSVLPNPPIRNVNTRWVGHAVVERKVLLVAFQQGEERLYCFDLNRGQWTKYASLPSYPGNFSGRTEFVEDTLYGCYHNTVAGISPLAQEEEEEEDEDEEEEEEEEEGEEEKDEAEEVQQVGSLFKHVRLLKHHRLHFVSEEMGMDAIFNVPPQLQSSSSLLHLGNRHFCYVKTGMPPDPIHGSDYAILDDKRRFISIVIFQVSRETYKEDATRLFRAKFLHSAHYVVDTPFPIEGFIDGCFYLGSSCFDTTIKGEASSTHMPLFFSKFSILELNVATRNFDPSLKIGAGGYGNTYKGVLHHTPVAIKMLASRSLQGTSEFEQEVGVLSKLRHPNLVTLIGVCPEVGAIIYEYLPNGSLEDRLNCKDNSPPLSWKIRICIAAEMCSALIFLHSCKPYSIVHGDVKPANILLDADFVSKLGDFGISSLLDNDQSSNGKFTCPKGTIGYIDPEFLNTGMLTQNRDVYSFGIVLLRLLTGRPPIGLRKDMQDALDTGNLKVFLDPLAGFWPFVQAEQLAHLALRCCELNPKSRPDLGSDVYRVLEAMMASCGSE